MKPYRTPLLTAADDKFYAELRELLREVLASRHTLEDLLQFVPLADIGQMGDLAASFLSAWRVFAPNGPDPFVLPE